MNKIDCLKEKWSRKAVGIAVLPLAIALGVLGLIVVPIAGVIFALPLMVLSFGLIMPRESNACRLLIENK